MDKPKVITSDYEIDSTYLGVILRTLSGRRM